MVKETFRLIFRNARLYLPLVLIGVVVALLNMGASMDTLIVFFVLTFLFAWLMTLFFTRHILNGDKVWFRDGLYNAATPMVSSLLIFLLIAVECLPVLLTVIGWSAAMETDLFNHMFYGSVFVLVAVLMVMLTMWLVAGNVMALIAVTTPVMYPMRALSNVRKMMRGKRALVMVRLLVIMVMSVACEMVAVLPVVMVGIIFNVDVSIAGIFATTIAGGFMTIFAAVYLYLNYREMIGMKGKKK